VKEQYGREKCTQRMVHLERCRENDEREENEVERNMKEGCHTLS